MAEHPGTPRHAREPEVGGASQHGNFVYLKGRMHDAAIAAVARTSLLECFPRW